MSPEVSDGDKDLLAHRAEERMQGLLFHQNLQSEGKSFRRESGECAKSLGQMIRDVGGLQRALPLGSTGQAEGQWPG